MWSDRARYLHMPPVATGRQRGARPASSRRSLGPVSVARGIQVCVLAAADCPSSRHGANASASAPNIERGNAEGRPRPDHAGRTLTRPRQRVGPVGRGRPALMHSWAWPRTDGGQKTFSSLLADETSVSRDRLGFSSAAFDRKLPGRTFRRCPSGRTLRAGHPSGRAAAQ